MIWSINKVKKALGGKLIGKPYMVKMVCATLLNLPNDTIEFICKKVWFISSSNDAWAFTFKGEELKDRYLVSISDELFEQEKEQIQFTILHEIGHILLNHRNSIGIEQTPAEIKQQEKQADEFANQYKS